MALNDSCLYQGELHYIVGDAVYSLFSDDGSVELVRAVLLNKIEITDPKGIQRAFWVRWADIVPFISNINYEYSEWTEAIRNGN